MTPRVHACAAALLATLLAAAAAAGAGFHGAPPTPAVWAVLGTAFALAASPMAASLCRTIVGVVRGSIRPADGR